MVRLRRRARGPDETPGRATLPRFCRPRVGASADMRTRPRSAAHRPRSAAHHPQSAAHHPQSADHRPQSAAHRPQSATREPRSAESTVLSAAWQAVSPREGVAPAATRPRRRATRCRGARARPAPPQTRHRLLPSGPQGPVIQCRSRLTEVRIRSTEPLSRLTEVRSWLTELIARPGFDSTYSPSSMGGLCEKPTSRRCGGFVRGS